MASIVAAQGLSGCVSWALEHKLNSYSLWARLLHGTWDLSGSGIKPVPPALAGGFLTSEPSGSPPGALEFTVDPW